MKKYASQPNWLMGCDPATPHPEIMVCKIDNALDRLLAIGRTEPLTEEELERFRQIVSKWTLTTFDKAELNAINENESRNQKLHF